jgi:membrane-associated protease RseP (regulator of RpoE activity)
MRGSTAGGAGGSELERLRALVARYFPVYESRVGPQSLLLAVHLDTTTLAAKFDELRQELWTLGYVPILRREHGEDFVEVIRRAPAGRRRTWINLLLLGATVATTTIAGAMIWLAYVGELALSPAAFVWGFLYFAGPLLAILGVHESAHYLVARRRHLDASLPYFIPIPPPYLLGTFGAFVSIREPFPDRRTLFDVGAAGPIAGFVMSLPIALGGLALTAHAPTLPVTFCGPVLLGQNYGNLIVGPNLIWGAFSLFFPTGGANLHPLALAGWVGILVTAINLLPAGSLDGGHIYRALLGDRASWVSYAAAFGLFALSIFYLGWAIFGVLVLLLGLRHPPPLNDRTPLDLRRYLVGALVTGILVSGFVLTPLAVPTGEIGLSKAGSVPWGSPPPGASVASNLSVTVENRDAVGHAFLFDVTVTNVSARVNNSTTYLKDGALVGWEMNATWRFVLPGGVEVGNFTGGSATLPLAENLSIASGASAPIEVELSNRASAVTAVVAFHASEICAPSGGGSATTDVSVLF